MNRLKVELLKQTFNNPLLPASGPSVGSLHSLEFFNENMVGGIVTKTISIEGAQVKKPCIVNKNNIIHNTELWSELPLKTWLNDILPQLKAKLKKPLIIGAGYSSDDFKISIPQLNPYADFYEVSTHYGKDGLKELVSTICSLTDKPVFIKLSPHIQDYLDFIKIAIENGASGIVAMNSLGPGTVIDLNKRAVTIGVKEGQSWISGPAIKPVALQRIMSIRKHYPELPLIACGGVSSAEDVLEFILAGADLVQMLSSALIKGRGLYDKIVSELPKKMDLYNIESIESLRKESLDLEPHGDGKFPNVSHQACIQCMKCIQVCPEIALTFNEKVLLDKSRCIRCGLCQSTCPTHAIKGVL